MIKLKLGITLLFLVTIQRTYGQRMTHTEILGRPTDKGITVQAFFDQNVEVSVKYGLQKGVYSNQTNWQTCLAGEPAEVEDRKSVV